MKNLCAIFLVYCFFFLFLCEHRCLMQYIYIVVPFRRWYTVFFLLLPTCFSLLVALSFAGQQNSLFQLEILDNRSWAIIPASGFYSWIFMNHFVSYQELVRTNSYLTAEFKRAFLRLFCSNS